MTRASRQRSTCISETLVLYHSNSRMGGTAPTSSSIPRRFTSLKRPLPDSMDVTSIVVKLVVSRSTPSLLLAEAVAAVSALPWWPFPVLLAQGDRKEVKLFCNSSRLHVQEMSMTRLPYPQEHSPQCLQAIDRKTECLAHPTMHIGRISSYLSGA